MKNRKSRKGPGWICAAHGPVLDLSAIIYGPLAITRALSSLTKDGFLDNRYAVTHVPTGLTPGVHHVEFKMAKKACEALLDSGVPWSKVTSKNAKKYGEKIKAALKSVGINL